MCVWVKKWGDSALVRFPASVMQAVRLPLDEATHVRQKSGYRPFALTGRMAEFMVHGGDSHQAGVSCSPFDGEVSGTPPWGYPTAFHRYAFRCMSESALPRGAAHARPDGLMRITPIFRSQ